MLLTSLYHYSFTDCLSRPLFSKSVVENITKNDPNLGQSTYHLSSQLYVNTAIYCSLVGLLYIQLDAPPTIPMLTPISGVPDRVSCVVLGVWRYPCRVCENLKEVICWILGDIRHHAYEVIIRKWVVSRSQDLQNKSSTLFERTINNIPLQPSKYHSWYTWC